MGYLGATSIMALNLRQVIKHKAICDRDMGNDNRKLSLNQMLNSNPP